MNRSGQAVIAVCKRFGLTPAQLLVVHDELDLPLGRVRFKQGGGLAGHNGLKSIAESLGTRDFDRLRLGIGRPGPGLPVDGYVLTSFPPEERDGLEAMLDLAIKGLRRYILDGLESAMNEVHPK
jgi:PTH1 family peptidyl-tRNA hydrolase